MKITLEGEPREIAFFLSEMGAQKENGVSVSMMIKCLEKSTFGQLSKGRKGDAKQERTDG